MAEAAGVAANERVQMRRRMEELEQALGMQGGAASGRLGSPPRSTCPPTPSRAGGWEASGHVEGYDDNVDPVATPGGSLVEVRAINQVLVEAHERLRNMEAELEAARAANAEAVQRESDAVERAERRAETIAAQFKRYVELTEDECRRGRGQHEAIHEAMQHESTLQQGA